MTDVDKAAAEFWRERSERDLSAHSLMNLEPDPDLARQKFARETARFEQVVQPQPEHAMVDLGAGLGVWAEHLASRIGFVYAVEREQKFVVDMRERLAARGIANIEPICSEASVYAHKGRPPVDLLFLSGLTIYLTDEQLDDLVGHAAGYVKSGGRVVHRDAYGVAERFVITQKHSERLDAEYSAIYRTRGEYDAIFARHGFRKIFDEDMFPDASKFNKWQETRLKITLYRR